MKLSSSLGVGSPNATSKASRGCGPMGQARELCNEGMQLRRLVTRVKVV